MTLPPLARAAAACTKAESVAGSRSMLRLPASSADVARISETSTGRAGQEQAFLAAHLNDADDIRAGSRIHAAAFQPRIDKRLNAGFAERARAARGDFAVPRRNHARRQIVRLKAVLANQLAKAAIRQIRERSADDTAEQAFVREVFNARLIRSTARTQQAERTEVPWMARSQECFADS